jgi:hypothetical protein
MRDQEISRFGQPTRRQGMQTTIAVMVLMVLVFALAQCCLENCPAEGNLDCGSGVKADPKTLECPSDAR